MDTPHGTEGRIDPSIEALTGKCATLREVGEAEKALEQLKAAIGKDSGLLNETRVLTALGDCERMAERFGKALDWYKKAAAKGDRGVPILLGLADSYRGLRSYSEAKEFYERILDKEPDNRAVLTRAGDVCVTVGELELAGIYFDRALKMGRDPYALIGLARIRKRAGDFRGALGTLEDAAEEFGPNPRIQKEIEEVRARIK
jgi:tetratricopeptide (TPR) repeat protein